MYALPGWEAVLAIAALWAVLSVAFTAVWAMAAAYYRAPAPHRRSRTVAA